ncbi:uncharacterized protein BCR38DRAFT_476600 [Pseudomassariella vexata]|uniref:Uncharacterized protein n=1 Tax=Pseudomassariella vexata TaxID=1141098 RepID=A0A1Y2DN78_9PEZI|nr:uncharacterized protein BCR38DRAFT_476600 [Pseudomassariella vexata]ORY60697.1 hypothetical protein BCR38DRAFT_476600 [Pseudomassariella vexata]
MVSFFGLKLGGDKKKKPEQPPGKSGSQLGKRIDQNMLGEGQFFGRQPGTHGYTASIYSTSRPASPHSYKVTSSSRKKQGVYASDTHNLAAVSMFDLSVPKPSQESKMPPLKPASSNPNLREQASNLGPTPVPRPATATTKQKPWVNPLDIHFNKPPTLVVPLTDMTTCGGSVPVSPNSQAPSPLRSKQQQQQQQTPAMDLRCPPSPPRSIDTTDSADHRPVLDKPVFPGNASARPWSSRNLRNAPSGLADVPQLITALPSPPLSIPRASDETSHRASVNQWGQPVIQNVQAMHQATPTSTTKRSSLELRVKAWEKPSIPACSHQRPRTSAGLERQPLPSPSLYPAPLNPSSSGSTSPWPGRQSPFAANQCQHAAVDNRPVRTGPPAAAVGAHGRPIRPRVDTTMATAPRPTAEDYRELVRRDSDASIYSSDSPLDSPVMPISGPLSSPRLAPPELHKLSTPAKELDTKFRFPDWSALNGYVPSPPSVMLNQPSPPLDSYAWPLPLPVAPSPFAPEPLGTLDSPRLPAQRSESPFSIPSFSRPWTPTNRPGTPVKTTEITTMSTPRDPVRSPLVPLPRPPVDYTLRKPPVLGRDFKNFI